MNQKKQLQQQRQQQEDAVLTKILYWIVGAVVLEFLLLLLNRYYVRYLSIESEIMFAYRLNTILPILGVVFLGVCVLCAVLTFRAKQAGKGAGLTGALSIFTLMLAASCMIARLFHDVGIRFLYVAVPVVAVLALIYYLYQHEFALMACLGVLGIMGVWMAARRGSSPMLVYGYAVALAVILVAVLALGRKLQSNKGMLKVNGKEVRIFPKGANYTLLYVTCLIVVAVVAVALALGALPLLYGVLVAWMLILAVYYTVRMM